MLEICEDLSDLERESQESHARARSLDPANESRDVGLRNMNGQYALCFLRLRQQMNLKLLLQFQIHLFFLAKVTHQV